jgi:ArsR family transcriptional regulator
MPIDKLESAFRTLADGTRLRILALLAGGEVCVCNIHGTLGVPQPTASRHLAYLRRAGFVEARRDGVWMHYRLASSLDPVVQGVLDAAIHALTHVSLAARDRKQYQKSFGALRVLEAPSGAACCAARP